MRFLSLRFSFLFAFLIAFSLVQTSATTLPKHHENEERDGHSRLHRPSSRSLLSFPLVATTALVVTLDGTMYLVDNSPGSMKVIWSLSTGSPIYQSYRAPVESDTDKENSSAALMSGFVECGDDWSLYMHDRHFGKMRISESIAEYVARTPTLSDDGAVTLGSKSSTLFEVDAKTGSIIQVHAMPDPVKPWSDGRQNVTNIPNIYNRDIADPVKLNSPQLLLKIFRTDYSLQSVSPSSEIVLWTMALAEFQAVLLCQHSSSDIEDEYVSDSGLNFTMPYPCQEIRQVFRLKKNFLFEPSLMLPWQPNIDRLFNGDDDNMMLSQPLIKVTTPREVYLNRTIEWPTPLPLVLFTIFLLAISLIYTLVIKDQETPKDQNSESELKSSPAKKKKTHKSGRKNDIIDKREDHMSSEDGKVLAEKDNDREVWKHFNHVNENVDGRRIGKIFVSNKEIAKGSNGTIVLEGIYEGRAVAIKRLVKAHNDIAFKEINNLIMSDFHPNIVRWHGVEYDNDFVYLALERCTCNLDDLVQIYSDISVNSTFRKDQGIGCLIKSQVDMWKDSTHCLWKENGYPSPLLLKLMRDIVSGVIHLHELGIIHRDMKPQNVLITKERSLCAKLSDMGISKCLLENMSSLGNNATGGGSSGWQAPEQLVQGRQTRAVDIFSLGCVFFFCITGGRHPFGERIERDINILNNHMDLFLVEFIPEAKDLISRLLNPYPDLRPKATEVLYHPFFWNSEKRLSFLRDTSDRVEVENRETNSDLLVTLESIATDALGGKWDERMEPAFIANIGHYRRYNFNSVRDLLRVMRNKLNHYRELPQEIQVTNTMSLRRFLGFSDGEVMRSDAKPCSRLMRHTAGIYSVGGALGFWILCRLHYGPRITNPRSLRWAACGAVTVSSSTALLVRLFSPECEPQNIAAYDNKK